MSGDSVATDNRTRRRRRRRRRMMAVGAVSALALAGCAGGNANPAIDIATVDGQAGFVPPTITVETDDKVDLRVTNTTDSTHGFRIEGYGITRLVDPTAPPEQVKFTAYRGGTFRIMCQLHEAHQTATLVVL